MDSKKDFPQRAQPQTVWKTALAETERIEPLVGARLSGSDERSASTLTSSGREARFVPGTMLAGRYRLVRLLGRGGMGEVYRADDVKLDQQVALKFLPDWMDEDGKTLGRFLEEVKIARQISHPNVCRVYDVGEVGGRHFLSMEYIDGEDLAALLRRDERLSKDRAIEIGRQICHGLAAAHQRGFLHRDLKPSNLMIDRQGEIRVTDFGLAGLASSITGPEIRNGTPAYMSPEQHAGRAVSVQSDLYALGLVLFKLFTGQSAFHGETAQDLAYLHRKMPPPLPSTLVDGLDASLERMILQCLEKDPGRRPASALDVAAVLTSSRQTVSGTVLKTLLVSEIADRGRWLADLGDVSGERFGRLLERIVQDLLAAHEGQEIRGQGPCLVFDRPINAVRYALAFHQVLRKLSQGEDFELGARLGIHLGEVGVREELLALTDSNLGALQMAKPTAGIVDCLRSLAECHQTLLTQGAFDLARQSVLEDFERVSWLAHGSYEISGLSEPVEIFEVGVDGQAPLEPPRGSVHARRRMVQATISGWRPAPELDLPRRPHWRIERKLGEGGFGEVWLAVHVKTGERRVFKFCYDPASLRALQREIILFRLLKETLGARDDMTRILDWNFDEAPYFIEAEYSTAGSLVDWAADQGGLAEVPLELRLEIVSQVATALAAAHSVGVLHKDVKPSNVLILKDASRGIRAQLSDFGVGLVTEKERLAEAGITVFGMTELAEGPAKLTTYGGTRLYMAPELLEGKPATLQADIYALGVMLYQMIVGDFSRVLASGWEQQIADELLREDIAVTVAGSPEDRLGAASQVADRLRALPARRAEREAQRREREETALAKVALVKAQKRRRALLVTVVVLGIFALAMIWQSRRIAREAEAARQVSQFLVDLFEVPNPDAQLADKITTRQILDWGAQKIESDLRDQPRVRARLLHTMGRVYGSLGLFDAAMPLIEESLAIRQQLFGERHVEVAASLSALANVLNEQGELERAQELAEKVLAMRQQLLAKDDLAIGEGLELLGRVAYFKGEHQDAERFYRQALDLRRSQSEPRGIADDLAALAGVLTLSGDYDQAVELYDEAIATYRQVLGARHPKIVRTLGDKAFLLQTKGGHEKAESLYREALAMVRELYGPDHPHVGSAQSRLAIFLMTEGDLDEAENLFGEVLELYLRVLGPDHLYVAVNLGHLARLAQIRGDLEGAERLYRQVIEIYSQLLGRNHPIVAFTMNRLAFLRFLQGDQDGAEGLCQESLEIVRKAEDHLSEASTLSFLAYFLFARGEVDQAERLSRDSLTLFQRNLHPTHSDVGVAMSNLAKAWVAQGKFEPAEELARKAVAMLHQVLPRGHYHIHLAESVLGAALAEAGQPDQAEALLLAAYRALRDQEVKQPLYASEALERLIVFYETRGDKEQAAIFRDDRKLFATVGKKSGDGA